MQAIKIKISQGYSTKRRRMKHNSENNKHITSAAYILHNNVFINYMKFSFSFVLLTISNYKSREDTEGNVIAV